MERPQEVEEIISDLEVCCDDDNILVLVNYIYRCEQKIRDQEIHIHTLEFY